MLFETETRRQAIQNQPERCLSTPPFFLPFYKAKQLLARQRHSNGVIFKGKELVPNGVKPFLLEFTPWRKEV